MAKEEARATFYEAQALLQEQELQHSADMQLHQLQQQQMFQQQLQQQEQQQHQALQQALQQQQQQHQVAIEAVAQRTEGIAAYWKNQYQAQKKGLW